MMEKTHVLSCGLGYRVNGELSVFRSIRMPLGLDTALTQSYQCFGASYCPLWVTIPRYRRVIGVSEHHTAPCGSRFRVIGELSVFRNITLPPVGWDTATTQSYQCFGASYCPLWVTIPRYRRVIGVSEHHTPSCGLRYRDNSELSLFWSTILPPVGHDSALSESHRSFGASYCLLWVGIPC